MSPLSAVTALAALRSGGTALPLLPVSVGRFFLRVSAFRKRLSVVPLLQEPVLLQSHQFFLHKYFLLK